MSTPTGSARSTPRDRLTDYLLSVGSGLNPAGDGVVHRSEILEAVMGDQDPHEGETCLENEARLDEMTGYFNSACYWLERNGVSPKRPSGEWDLADALAEIFIKHREEMQDVHAKLEKEARMHAGARLDWASCRTRVEQQQALIEKVRAIHRDVDGYCPECLNTDETSVPWPCATAQAANDEAWYPS